MRGIEIKEVSKGYKDTKALDHVSVQFEDGKIYALLGRNGVCDGTCRDVRTLSTGYKSIFKLVLALSVNVPYLFLDEPVLGLDANHREMFYRILLEKYIEEPFTIVISTHLIEEVASVIEHVVILKDGKIVKKNGRKHRKSWKWRSWTCRRCLSR